MAFNDWDGDELSDGCSNAEYEKEFRSKKIKTIVKYSVIGLIIIVICVLLGLSSHIKTEREYQRAINRVICSDEHHFYFPIYSVDKPDYKDTKGWELYARAKGGDSYAEEELLKYQFKHINKKQARAIEELRNEIRTGTNKRVKSRRLL